MNKDEKKKRLKELYFEIKELNIPKSAKNDELAEWIDNIIYLDAYYAGLALSVAEGEKILLSDLYDVTDYERKLNLIKVSDERDIKILEFCKHYLFVLIEADELLRTI